MRMMTGLLLSFWREILRIRDDDDDFRVLFSDGGSLSTSELNCILPCFVESFLIVLNF